MGNSGVVMIRFGWIPTKMIEQKMTDWPDLKPNDLVLYQNDETRPCRLVLSKFADGYGIHIDTPLFDSRVAPSITRSELIEIAVKMIRATR